MKLTFYILLFYSINILPQNFVPLSNKNKFQSHYNLYAYSHGGGTVSLIDYSEFSIVGDTIINDIKLYKFRNFIQSLNHPYPINSYLYYDSTEQKLFIKYHNEDLIRLAIDFNIPKDSSFVSYLPGGPRLFISYGKSKNLIFGDSVFTFKVIGTWSNLHEYYYEVIFVEDFGLYYYKHKRLYTQDGSTFEARIVSAIIDSIFINPITLKITNLTPLSDRPLNSFPFLLSGFYETNYNLVDTFYVEIIHERDSLVLNEFTIPFNTSGYAQINNNGFMSGDVLKLKAVASDRSIYNNLAFFPENGYAIINILKPTNLDNENLILYNFSLSQNYPNPFNPSTVISFQLPVDSYVELIVYDVLGREVAVLVNNYLEQGNHEIEFITEEYNLNSGVYFYQLRTGEFVETRKMILLR